MKVEEIFQQDHHNQVGVTLQRIPFETEIDIFPKLNPFLEGDGDSRGTGEVADRMSELTSVQTEELLCKVAKHKTQDGEEEFQPIPLKRLDSGPHQHCVQGLEEVVGNAAEDKAAESESTHNALLSEIDTKTGSKAKTGKKDNTLTRMLKGIRLDKESTDESGSKLSKNLNISKIFHRVNPVGKQSRENFSKVMHRIGDALQQRKSAGETKTGEDMSPSHKPSTSPRL